MLGNICLRSLRLISILGLHWKHVRSLIIVVQNFTQHQLKIQISDCPETHILKTGQNKLFQLRPSSSEGEFTLSREQHSFEK